jgi:hypothetical protein
MDEKCCGTLHQGQEENMNTFEHKVGMAMYVGMFLSA